MPRKTVTDLITDQEMAFARLVLGGTMNDREAAQAAGLNPDTAAYTKSKPRVREFMLEHRAAVQQQLAAREAEDLRQRDLRRERLLDRLWAIADTSAETTRGSFTSQIKALSMIGAMDGFFPDRRAGSSSLQPAEKESTPPPGKAQIYQAAWLREQKEKAMDSEPTPEHAQQEEEPGLAEAQPEPAPEPITPATTLDPLAPERTSWVPDAFTPPDAPDIRAPFWKQQKNRFGRRR